MESALSSLILFSLGLFAAITLSHTFLETQDAVWTAEQTRRQDVIERERTDIEITGADTQSSGEIVRVIVRNNGQTKLADFDRWDVVVQFYSDPPVEDPDLYPDIYHVEWLPYTSQSLEEQQWTISGIYVSAESLAPEVYEPGILNPDEEMVIHARLSPGVAMTTTNRITINTLNGISASSHFLR